MARRAELILAGLVLIVLAPPPVATHGQALVNTGHSLDSNLRIGSGGYNGGVSSGSIGGGMGNIGGAAHRGFRGGGGGGMYSGRYGVSRTTLDEYNAFSSSRQYNPSRFDAGYRTGAHFNPAGNTQMLRPSQSVDSNAYGAGFDSGYEAGLADAHYEEGPAKLQMETLAYGIGFAFGEKIRTGLENDGVTFDLETVVNAFREGLNDTPAQLGEEEMEEILESLHEQVLARMVKWRLETDPAFRARHDRNLATSQLVQQDFERDGREVVTLPSGIKYREVKPGRGAPPTRDDAVIVSYRVFDGRDKLVAEGTERRVEVNDTVEGVQIILTLMPVGAKWEVAIPSDLAYGAAGHPPEIGPNQALTAEIELLEIE